MKKILVVNNDFDTMELLKLWLEKREYTVQYTANKDEVKSILKEFNPGLVIVDVLQKEVAEKIKFHKETRKLPVLLMTGYGLRPRASQHYADDMIEKPFNLFLLEKKIEKLLNSA